MKEGVRTKKGRATYNGIRIHPVLDGIYIRGYVINGVAKEFKNGGEAFAFIDRLKNYTVIDGDLVEWEE
jgi:hypothetical protein